MNFLFSDENTSLQVQEIRTESNTNVDCVVGKVVPGSRRLESSLATEPEPEFVNAPLTDFALPVPTNSFFRPFSDEDQQQICKSLDVPFVKYFNPENVTTCLLSESYQCVDKPGRGDCLFETFSLIITGTTQFG